MWRAKLENSKPIDVKQAADWNYQGHREGKWSSSFLTKVRGK